MPTTPRNPYRTIPNTVEARETTAEEWVEYSRMQQLGHPSIARNVMGDSRELQGNFIYLPQLDFAGDGSQVATGYNLCVFLATPLAEGDEKGLTHAYWLSSTMKEIPNP